MRIKPDKKKWRMKSQKKLILYIFSDKKNNNKKIRDQI
jgi:hypothetical protein